MTDKTLYNKSKMSELLRNKETARLLNETNDTCPSCKVSTVCYYYAIRTEDWIEFN